LPLHDWVVSSFLTLVYPVPPQAVLDVIVDDELQFFVGEPIVLGQDSI
jgi:hypothetical protein